MARQKEVINDQRYAELDWLRVILIFAVYIHHVLMPFNGDNWHIMNNESSKLLDDIMVYFEQFRLPILFFISGAGAVILLSKVSAKQFAFNKTYRLILPLIIGVFFVVPPQTYIESIEQHSSFWAAYPQLALQIKLNHLWFIEYLIVFSFLAIPLYAILCTSFGKRLIKAVKRIAESSRRLFSLVILLAIIKISFSLLFPSDDNKIENLSSSTYFFFFFVSGMIFIRDKTLWQSILEKRRHYLKILIISSFVFYSYYYSPDLSPYMSLDIRWSIWWFVCCLVSWSALLTILGYAQYYFTQSPTWLRASNELIYPFYIFHQTVIVVIGYYVIAWQSSLLVKIIALFAASFIITSVICYFIVKPFRLLRILFGLKPLKAEQ